MYSSACVIWLYYRQSAILYNHLHASFGCTIDKVQPYVLICMRHLVAGSVDKVQPYSSLPRPPHPHPFSPSLIGLMVSVDVKHHVYLLIHLRVSFGGATDNNINGEHTIQLNSKTLIIPQGAVLLWSWRAHKKYIKLREQYNKQKSLALTVA